jgi:hypothetical protein
MDGPMLLSVLLLAAQATPEAVATADAGTATRAFADICLSNSGIVEDARRDLEAAGFVRGRTLPGLMGGAPLDTYDKPPLSIGLRQRRSGGSSCIVIFAPDAAADNAAVAAAVTTLPGLALRSSKGSARSWRATWTPLRAPKGSKVYLTIGDGIGHRSAILTLEAEAKK